MKANLGKVQMKPPCMYFCVIKCIECPESYENTSLFQKSLFSQQYNQLYFVKFRMIQITTIISDCHRLFDFSNIKPCLSTQLNLCTRLHMRLHTWLLLNQLSETSSPRRTTGTTMVVLKYSGTLTLFQPGPGSRLCHTLQRSYQKFPHGYISEQSQLLTIDSNEALYNGSTEQKDKALILKTFDKVASC